MRIKICAILCAIILVMTGCTHLVTMTDHHIKEEIHDIKEDIKEDIKDIEQKLPKPDTSDTVTDDITDTEVISAVSEHFAALNDVVSESFGVELTEDGTYYLAIYPESQTEDFGELDHDTLLIAPSEISNLPEGYIYDPTGTMFMQVTNYKSEDDVERKYGLYMDEDVFDDALDDNFEEYKGILYLARGGRGYGAVGIDHSAPEIVAHIGDTYVIKVTKLLFEQPHGDLYVEFRRTSDGFKIVNYKETWVGN